MLNIRKNLNLAQDALNYGQRLFKSRMNALTVKSGQFGLLVDGKIVPSQNGRYFDLVNPSSGKTFASAADATVADMQNAILSARRAFDEGPWPKMTVAERGIYLKKTAEIIRKNAKELSDLETFNGGKTLKHSTFIDVPTAADTFEYFGGVSGKLFERENKLDAPVKSKILAEPMGVVGLIIPWNYPMIMSAWKMAPALAAGNTVILKPSSASCAAVLKLAELMTEAGFPEGVVNILTTKDHAVTEEMVKSPLVDMISFTGGTETGRHVMELASKTTKKVVLELGGKSPGIVFADCNFDAAVGGVMASIFMNQGQMCTAISRLFIEDKIYDGFVKALVQKTMALHIGDAADYQTNFGPVVSLEHRDRILKSIRDALKDGAVIECGGRIPSGEGLGSGFYVEPTILTNVVNSIAVAQEEIFGPVLCVMKFSNTEEAVQQANDSRYGLAACIWTKDERKAAEVAKQLQCGTVWVNTYGGFYNEAPFGGYKQSGTGRELGLEGLLEYTQTKHICTDATPNGRPLVTSWF